MVWQTQNTDFKYKDMFYTITTVVWYIMPHSSVALVYVNNYIIMCHTVMYIHNLHTTYC